MTQETYNNNNNKKTLLKKKNLSQKKSSRNNVINSNNLIPFNNKSISFFIPRFSWSFLSIWFMLYVWSIKYDYCCSQSANKRNKHGRIVLIAQYLALILIFSALHFTKSLLKAERAMLTNSPLAHVATHKIRWKQIVNNRPSRSRCRSLMEP